MNFLTLFGDCFLNVKGFVFFFLTKLIIDVPPFTDVKSLDFEDYSFELESWNEPCSICGSTTSFLDEIITDDEGTRLFICSDTEYCQKRSQGGE